MPKPIRNKPSLQQIVLNAINDHSVNFIHEEYVKKHRGELDKLIGESLRNSMTSCLPDDLFGNNDIMNEVQEEIDVIARNSILTYEL